MELRRFTTHRFLFSFTVLALPLLSFSTVGYGKDQDLSALKEHVAAVVALPDKVMPIELPAPAEKMFASPDWEHIGKVPLIEPTPEAIAEASRVTGNIHADPQTSYEDFDAMFVDMAGNAWIRRGASTLKGRRVNLEESGWNPEQYAEELVPTMLEESSTNPVAANWILSHADRILESTTEDEDKPFGEESNSQIGGFSVPTRVNKVILGGSDGMQVVTLNNVLTGYPRRTIGKLGGCTATKIGPRHVITSAHCAHNCRGSWFSISGLTFSPGQEGNPNNPFSQDHNGGPRPVVGRYARSCTTENDYALFIIQDSSSFTSLGWVGRAWWNDLNAYNAKQVEIWGYPLDGEVCAASFLNGDVCGGWMYGMTSYLASGGHTSGYLYYWHDTLPGMSGSSVLWRSGSGGWYTLGVHKRGNDWEGYTISSDPAFYNVGARMRGSMWNDICDWIGDPNYPSNFANHPCE